MTIDVTIESLAAGGDGVARQADGRVVFVQAAAPGDRVRVELVEEKKSFARARVLEVVQQGPDRVTPPCKLAAEASCGGCQWQHVSLKGQLAAKEAIAAAALRKLVAQGLEIAPIISGAPALGWRRRSRLQWVRARRASAAIVGLFAPRSDRVTDVEECLQLEPALQTALADVRRLLAPALTGRGEIHLVVGHAGAVHMVIDGPCKPAALEGFVEASSIDGVALGRRNVGVATIELEPGVQARADGFAQASAAGNAALLDAVDHATRPRAGLRVVEFHAGAGNLTRVLTAEPEPAQSVIAIDRHLPPAAPASFPGGERVEFRHGLDTDAVALLARRGESFGLALLDPPRTGAADLMKGLARLAPERIVYVSCDPATLARDVGQLVAKGYNPVRAQPIDLMPQTSHVEVVLTLIRSSD